MFETSSSTLADGCFFLVRLFATPSSCFVRGERALFFSRAENVHLQHFVAMKGEQTVALTGWHCQSLGKDVPLEFTRCVLFLIWAYASFHVYS